MRVQMPMLAEVDVAYIQVHVPVHFGEEDIPQDFPFRFRDIWKVIIGMDDGKIMGWRQGLEYTLCMKVFDGGSYTLLDEDLEVIAKIDGVYVPDSAIPGDPDYLEFSIASDGTITNWYRKPQLDDFFPEAL